MQAYIEITPSQQFELIWLTFIRVDVSSTSSSSPTLVKHKFRWPYVFYWGLSGREAQWFTARVTGIKCFTEATHCWQQTRTVFPSFQVLLNSSLRCAPQATNLHEVFVTSCRRWLMSSSLGSDLHLEAHIERWSHIVGAQCNQNSYELLVLRMLTCRRRLIWRTCKILGPTAIRFPKIAVILFPAGRLLLVCISQISLNEHDVF